MYERIKVELCGDLLILRQNNPGQLNARDERTHLEITAAMKAARENDAVSAVLLSSTGRYFCAGMNFRDTGADRTVDDTDSPELAAEKQILPASNEINWLHAATNFILEFVRFDKPLFAAVNGPAVGEGFTSLLHCDVVFASDTASFWAPFARAGAVPEFASTLLLPRRLGTSLGHAAIYLGRKITVEEARIAGFVVEVLPAGENFEDQVIDRVLQGMALLGPRELRMGALREFKKLVYGELSRAELEEQCRRELAYLVERRRSGETERVREYYADQLPSHKK